MSRILKEFAIWTQRMTPSLSHSLIPWPNQSLTPLPAPSLRLRVWSTIKTKKWDQKLSGQFHTLAVLLALSSFVMQECEVVLSIFTSRKYFWPPHHKPEFPQGCRVEEEGKGWPWFAPKSKWNPPSRVGRIDLNWQMCRLWTGLGKGLFSYLGQAQCHCVLAKFLKSSTFW